MGNFVGKLLRFGSDSPLEQLQKFADIGENLKSAGLGVLNLSDQFEAYQKLRLEKKTAIPYPWAGLNKKLEGLRVYQNKQKSVRDT